MKIGLFGFPMTGKSTLFQLLTGRVGFCDFEEEAIDEHNIEEATLEGMRECFRPEFINRIDEVVVFNPLDIPVCTRIARRVLKEVSSLLATQGIKVEFSSGVKSLLAREGFSEEYGARELRRLIKRKIEDPLTDLILTNDLAHEVRIQVKVRRGEPVFEVTRSGKTLVGSA